MTVEEHRKKSKQSEKVFYKGFKLDVPEGQKICDQCAKYLDDNTMIVLIYSREGYIFYFCTDRCMLDFIIKEMKGIKKRYSGYIS